MAIILFVLFFSVACPNLSGRLVLGLLKFKCAKITQTKVLELRQKLAYCLTFKQQLKLWISWKKDTIKQLAVSHGKGIRQFMIAKRKRMIWYLVCFRWVLGAEGKSKREKLNLKKCVKGSWSDSAGLVLSADNRHKNWS